MGAGSVVFGAGWCAVCGVRRCRSSLTLRRPRYAMWMMQRWGCDATMWTGPVHGGKMMCHTCTENDVLSTQAKMKHIHAPYMEAKTCRLWKQRGAIFGCKYVLFVDAKACC
eukprot:2660450-Rhodomonas_salina.2